MAQIKASYVPLHISEGLYIVPEWSEPQARGLPRTVAGVDSYAVMLRLDCLADSMLVCLFRIVLFAYHDK